MRRIKTFSNGKKQTMPIKSKKKIKEILYYLLSKREKAKIKNQINRYKQYDRNYMLVLIGLNTAFRAEDLLQLRVKDLVNGYIHIKENKTGKSQIFNIRKELLNDIKAFVDRSDLTEFDYMFMSQRKDGAIGAISRQQADRIIKDIKKKLNINFCFGMHSLRKTFGYQKYKDTNDIMTIMRMYNHDSPDVTMRYIMWDTNDVEKAREGTYIGVDGREPQKQFSRE